MPFRTRSWRSANLPRVHRGSWALRLAFVLGFAACSVGTAGADERSPFAVPPGQEAVVLRMFAGDERIGPCRLEDADIPGDRVIGTFRCDGVAQAVRVVLTHKGEGACVDRCTERFRIGLEGAAPSGFVDALEANLRRHEAAFRWVRLTRSPREPAWHFAFGKRGVGLAFGLLIAFLVYRALRKRPEETIEASPTPPASTDAAELPGPPQDDR